MEKDEEKLMSRKRLEKWAKIFLVFLAFVWLCTIISKSIYVSGLTVVKTDTPSKKYVEHVVEADGIVTTGGEIAVNTLSGLRVDRLYVMQGDEVKAGDVLFTVNLKDIGDIISAKEAELSKLQYNLSDIQVNAVIDAQKKEVAILWAQEDYETADKETAVAKERAKEALDKAIAELETHLADTVPYTSDSARGDAWNAYHDWVNKGYSISDQVTAKQREIRDLEEQLAQLGTGKVLSGAAGSDTIGNETAESGGNAEDSSGHKEGSDTPQADGGLNSEGDTGGNGGPEPDGDIGNGNLATDNTTDSNDDANVGNNASTGTGEGADNDTDTGNKDSADNNTDGTVTDSKDSADNNIDDTVTDNKDSIGNNTDSTGTDNKDSTDNSTDSTGTDNKDGADNTDSTVTDDKDSADNNTNGTPGSNDKGDSDTNTGVAPDNNEENAAERAELQEKIRKANEELLALQDELTRHGRNEVEQPDYSEEELKFDEWQNTRLALEANVQKAKENYNDISYNREVTLRQKMRDIASLQVTTRVDSTAALYELDMKQIQAQLASLYSIKKQKGEINAENDGIISKIQVEVGGRTSDMAAVLMTDMQRPCQFKFSITKEQGKYVQLNDTVNLKLNGQSELEVTVDYFMENTQGGYDLICMLPEGVGKPGLIGNIKKSVQGEYHSLALPVDAVFEETGGYFIYTLNEKEGILGSEYYAEKIKVQVKDKNDRFAALESGTISEDTKVIIYSTKELKQGESVRPQEK